jgi:hypothetical protein
MTGKAKEFVANGGEIYQGNLADGVKDIIKNFSQLMC